MSTKALPRRISFSEARQSFRKIEDDVGSGISHIIIRNRRAVAAVVKPEVALLAPIVREVLLELGESIKMSENPDIIAAVNSGMQDIVTGRTATYEV